MNYLFDVLIPGALSKDLNEIGARIGIDFFFCGTLSFVRVKF